MSATELPIGLVDRVCGNLDGFLRLVVEQRAERLAGICESPIEILLGAALWSALDLAAFGFLERAPPPPRVSNADDGGQGTQLIPQYRVENMRVDFLLIERRSGIERRVIIECDGHEFHERTKEQAARDRSRDRKLQLLGFTVLRFTGSEIWGAVDRCLLDIIHALRPKRAE